MRHKILRFVGRLSPNTGSIITTASAYNSNYTLTTMQALPPISTVTSSAQEKYIIIQTNGIRSHSMEPMSPPQRRINQHASLTHSDSALSDCSLSTSGQSSEVSQYPQDTSNAGYYHTSCPTEPSPPSADSGSSSCGSSAYGSMMPTYNLNIKYEYDVKTEDETPCDIQQSNNNPESSFNSNNENGQVIFVFKKLVDICLTFSQTAQLTILPHLLLYHFLPRHHVKIPILFNQRLRRLSIHHAAHLMLTVEIYLTVCQFWKKTSYEYVPFFHVIFLFSFFERTASSKKRLELGMAR